MNLETNDTWDIDLSLNGSKISDRLYTRYNNLIYIISNITNKVVKELYKNTENKEYYMLSEDIDSNNYLAIDEIIEENAINNEFLNNFKGINNNELKSIIKSNVLEQIDRDEQREKITKAEASKMREVTETEVNKCYDYTLNLFKEKDDKKEKKLKEDFDKWQEAYKNKDLDQMKKIKEEITKDTKCYTEYQTDVIYDCLYAEGVTNYLMKKEKKGQDLELTDEEKGLFDKLIKKELSNPQPSKELRKEIDEYVKLFNDAKTDEELKEVERRAEKIREQAKKENVEVGVLKKKDTSGLERILQELRGNIENLDE